jgi:hypothetical protein
MEHSTLPLTAKHILGIVKKSTKDSFWSLSEYDSNPCDKILAMTTSSDAAVDTIDTLSESWFASSSGTINELPRFLPISPLKLVVMCSGNEDCGDSRGKYKNDICECSEDLLVYGLRCEDVDRTKTCRELVTDKRTEPFVFQRQKLRENYSPYY